MRIGCGLGLRRTLVSYALSGNEMGFIRRMSIDGNGSEAYWESHSFKKTVGILQMEMQVRFTAVTCVPAPPDCLPA